MPENDVQITIKPYFSPEKIEHFNKWMRDRVALVLRLQDTGEIPCASRIPRCHVKRSDIPMILGVSYTEAGRVVAYVRQECNLKKRQYISIYNFCKATCLKENEVKLSLDK